MAQLRGRTTGRRTLRVVFAVAFVLVGRAVYAQCSDVAVCSGAAGGVFCTGFEEANPKALWDDYDGNPNTHNEVLDQAGPCATPGNTVMRLKVPPGRGAADLVKVLPSTHDKLYARWYQYWEPGYDFSAQNHGGGLHAGDRGLLGQSGNRPNGQDWFTSWFEPLAGSWNGNNLSGFPYLYSYYPGMYQQCGSPGNCFGDALPCMYDEGSGFCTKPQHRETVMPPRLETGRWYCVEVMLDGGTPTATAAGANGVQDFWVDNVEIGPWTDLWHRTTSNLKISILWLNLFHHAEHSTVGVMLDDVVVSTQRIGCHGGSLPSAPKNLRIIPGM